MQLIDKFTRLHQQLIALTHSTGFIELTAETRIKSILTFSAHALNVARISVWSLNSKKDTIHCELLYLRASREFDQGAILHKETYPSYFQAIEEDRIIAANDAYEDPRTKEFTEGYLKPLQIRSMLDAPIFSKNQLYGVLCIEQVETLKEWDIAELSFSAAIADTITLIIEQEAWLNTQDKLQLLEQIDSLTALESRRFFNQRILNDLEKKPPSNSRLLLVVGLDFFTAINDTYGSLAADNVLKVLADRFSDLVRDQGIKLSRLGGDQFGFWVSNVTSEEFLSQLIEQIHAQVKIPIRQASGESIDIESSIGAVVYPNDNIKIKDPIRCAEVALEYAKENTRGSAQFFSPDWANELQSRRNFEKEIIDAFEKQQFVAFYQPIVSASTGEISGLEALARWRHPNKGIIPPAAFLPIIAELGLMGKLGEIMLDHAFRELNILHEEDIQLEWVAVNLSAEQLYAADLVPMIERKLNQYNVSSSLIQLEIVEELFSKDSELICAKLQAIADLGVKLSIDDFGTGYSSLSRLKHIPVSKLKIDKSFVDGLPNSSDDACITRSIIGLAKGMEIDIVAEGVETVEQARWLYDHGCDFIQGYYFAKPMCFDDIRAYILKRKQRPLAKDGHYELSLNDRVLTINAHGRWSPQITEQLFLDIAQQIATLKDQPWATIVDVRHWIAGPLEVQQLIKKSSVTLVNQGLILDAYIIGDSDLVKYQLELMAPKSKSVQRRYFCDKASAISWLKEEGFNEAG